MPANWKHSSLFCRVLNYEENSYCEYNPWTLFHKNDEKLVLCSNKLDRLSEKIYFHLFRECYQFRVLHSVKQAPSPTRKVWIVKKFVEVKRSSFSKVYNTINCGNRLKVTDLLALKSPKGTQEQFLKAFLSISLMLLKDKLERFAAKHFHPSAIFESN